MTAIEHQVLKGITVKNLFITVMSTASIVASVMTTYFGLKGDIQEIRAAQDTETRINNIRLKVLEDHITLLQKEVDEIKFSEAKSSPVVKSSPEPKNNPALLTSVDSK